MKEGAFGKEAVIDLHDCDVSQFTVERIEVYFKELCNLIDMEMVEAHYWEDHESEELHLQGVSAIQFIKTSNVTIHAITKMEKVYLNIFSCKDFNENDALKFSIEFFGGYAAQVKVFDRE